MDTNLKIYQGLSAKILNYLKGGATRAQTALALGCDVSTIDHLMQEDDFRGQVEKYITKNFQDAVELDKNLLETEVELAKKIKNFLPLLINLDDVLKTFRVVNGAKKALVRDISPSGAQDVNTQKPVTLILPKVIINNFIMNPNSEIVEVDGTQLVTLNSSSLDGLIATQQIEDARILEETPVLNIPELIPNLQLTPKAIRGRPSISNIRVEDL